MILTCADKIGIAGMSVLLINIFLQTWIFPSILKSAVKKKVALKSGWPMRTAWSKSPYPVEHQWYIFNVTNPAEIDKGGKPIVQEIGPFVYDMWQEKIKQEDHEEDDTLSYTLKNIYFFNPSKSSGLNDDDQLITPHLLMLGIPNGLMRDRPFLVPLASRAMDSVMRNPQSMFVRAKVRTILYDGFQVDCQGIEDFHGKLLCNEIRNNYEDLFFVKLSQTLYSLSLWGSFNDTERMGRRLRVRRGIKNVRDVGKLEEFEGKKNFSAWNTDRCNAFHGSDFSGIFSPFLNKKKKEAFFVTYTLLCRILQFTYDSTVDYKGLKLLRYTAIVGTDGQRKPEDKCYCLHPDQCPPKGVFDLYKCLGVPLIISSPHFYQADEHLVGALDGIKPDKDKHMMIVDVDPLTGYAVRVNMRLQISLNIMPLQKYRLMKSFPEVLLPLVWFDQQIVLPLSFIKAIKASYGMLMIFKAFNYLSMLTGLGMCAYGGYHQYKLRRDKQLNTITELSQENSAKHSSDGNKMPPSSASIPTAID